MPASAFELAMAQANGSRQGGGGFRSNDPVTMGEQFRSGRDEQGIREDFVTGEFSVGGIGRNHGVAQPGQDIQVRGLNDFISASRDTADARRGIRAAANQQGREQAVEAGHRRVDQSFDTAEGVQGRRLQGLGQQLSRRQKKLNKRNFSLGRAVAKADVAGTVNRGFADTARTAAKEASGIEDSIRAIENSGHVGLSNAAGQEAVRAANDKADSSAAGSSNAAAGIGIIISLASMMSDENVKHDKRPTGSLLDKLKDIRVEKWKYKGDDQDHIGPYAKDFNEAFGVGRNQPEGQPKMISLIDAIGVTMGAIKELNEKVDAHG